MQPLPRFKLMSIKTESDADAAIAAVQADVDANETGPPTTPSLLSKPTSIKMKLDADAAIAAVQADVDQNEADA